MKAAAVNACKLCSPLGAALAFKGVEGAVSLLHGSQGCATYIRRYMISHFREPVDIASSNFSEEGAVFGGKKDFFAAADNVSRQYGQSLLGAASTCLAATIGEDMAALAREYEGARPEAAPVAAVQTAAYCGSHRDGYWAAARAILERLAAPAPRAGGSVGIIPAMVSCADLRWLKSLSGDCPEMVTVFPDWSDTLDSGPWEAYSPIPAGGTPLSRIRALGGAETCLELGSGHLRGGGPAAFLEKAFGVKSAGMRLPMGIQATDAFLDAFQAASGLPVPERELGERSRLADLYADAHKLAYGKRALVFGDEDFCLAMAAFLAETGMVPALVACGGDADADLAAEIKDALPEADRGDCRVLLDADFEDMGAQARGLGIDVAIGNSKGYKLSGELGVPLVRSGFPVHDRFGGQRIRHLGYSGGLELYERILNELIASAQAKDAHGYWYF
jgi:nitrogenase molybdenum-iron protein NifN